MARKTDAERKPDAFPNPSFTPVSMSDIPQVSRETKTGKLIEEFIASGAQAGEVTDGAPNFHASLKRYVKANSAPVKVVHKGGTTYLVRADTDDETQAQPAEA